MKKTFLIICCLLCLTTYSKPKQHVHRHSPRPVVHHRHGPYKHHSHHRHNHCGSFITGAVVGGLVTTLLTPSQPVVVTTPTPVIVQQPQQIWVPGKWIITYDNHGRQIKTWQPGYWTTVIQ
jgi:hypothetical protein